MDTWLMQQSYNKRLHENEMAYEKHGGKGLMEFVVVHHMDHEFTTFFFFLERCGLERYTWLM